MIKKSVFEKELISGMHKELVKNASFQDKDNLEKAVDYLNSAVDIFEDVGMKTQADKILNILYKISCDENDVKKVNDPHTKGLTSKKMLSNLKEHGTVFNLANDGQAADDLLNLDVDGDLEVSEKDLIHDFEDEI